MFLKSSHIIPIEGPNLSPGYLCVRDGVIHAVGDEFVLSMQEKGEDFIDLGKMVLLPGFVNAHCHLELTAIGPISPAPFPPPLKGGGISGTPSPLRGEGWGEGGYPDFVEWVKEVVRRKNSLTEDEKIDGIKKGIARLMHSGVTCIGDHISFNTPLEAIVKSPLKGRLFGEVLGVLPEVSEDIYATFKNRQKEFSQSASRFTLHASPHSVHAVDPDTLRRVLTEQPAPLSCHLAESKTEEEYFRTEKGVLARFIRERRHDIRHQGKSGLDYLEKQNLPLEKLLIVHGNYLTPEDLERIKKRSLSIVHCPGSHEYFGHESFPLAEYLAQGINVALGTDSIAGNTDLDFLKELRRVRKKFPALTALQILKAATLNGARALGLQDEIGSLVSGKKADIIGFLLSKNMNPEEAPFLANSVDWMMSGQRRDALCRE